MYVADDFNHRVMAWSLGASQGIIVAGGNGAGVGLNQLNRPSDIVLDEMNNYMIICDRFNERIIQWPHQNGSQGLVLVTNISCFALTIDQRGSIYATEPDKNRVIRVEHDGSTIFIVAGGSTSGSDLHQLNGPQNLYIDQFQSLYISDLHNNRLMKWSLNASQGIVVGGFGGRGSAVNQLSNPRGIIADQSGNIYIADDGNNRIIRISNQNGQASVIIASANLLSMPVGISFDFYGNLYVVSSNNHKVFRFDLIA